MLTLATPGRNWQASFSEHAGLAPWWWPACVPLACHKPSSFPIRALSVCASSRVRVRIRILRRDSSMRRSYTRGQAGGTRLFLAEDCGEKLLLGSTRASVGTQGSVGGVSRLSGSGSGEERHCHTLSSRLRSEQQKNDQNSERCEGKIRGARRRQDLAAESQSQGAKVWLFPCSIDPK